MGTPGDDAAVVDLETKIKSSAKTSARDDGPLEQCDSRCILPFQKTAREYYESPLVQNGVAAMIMLNFLVSAIEQERYLDIPNDLFSYCELVFNIAFLLELILNHYANNLCGFWSSGWNVFDFFIVSAAWMSYVLPSHAELLQLCRPFRVFRLCRRIEKLRTITSGIVKSLPGVVNACIILALVAGIWSIMGVEFFGREYVDDENGEFKDNLPGDFSREFGHFTRGLLTLYQISTFDSWSSGVSRKIILDKGWITFVYFISYSFAASIIMLNVIVAILLDNFIAAAQEAERQAEEQKQEQRKAAQAKSDMIMRIVKLQRTVRAWRGRRALDLRIKSTREKKENAVLCIQGVARTWLTQAYGMRQLEVGSGMPRLPHDEEEAEMMEMRERVERLQQKTEQWYDVMMAKIQIVVKFLEESDGLPIHNAIPVIS